MKLKCLTTIKKAKNEDSNFTNYKALKQKDKNSNKENNNDNNLILN